MNWPNSGRIAVMMAFDLDGESLWEANHTPIDTLNAPRGSYGPLQGTPRILNLLERRGIPATFFVPGVICRRCPEQVRAIAAAGHEIAAHGDAQAARGPDAGGGEPGKRGSLFLHGGGNRSHGPQPPQTVF